MKTIFMIILISTFLIGCSGIDVNECEIENSYTVNQVDQYGLTLLPSNRMFITFEEVSQIYQDVQACMGLTAEPPEVQFTSFSKLFFGLDFDEGVGGGAVYIVPARRIVVNTDASETFKQTCQSDREYVSHEMVHHILSMNDIRKQSREHTSSLFAKCIIKNTTD